MRELKSCPFCGNTDDAPDIEFQHHGMVAYFCQSCGTRGPKTTRPETAATAWNNRHTDDLIAAAEGMYKACKEVVHFSDRKTDIWDRAKEALAKWEEVKK